MTNVDALFHNARMKALARSFEKDVDVLLFDDFSYTTTESLANGYEAWLKSLELDSTYAGVIGGRLIFHINPTSLGTVVKVSDDITKTEFDLTDYGSW